MKKIILQIFVVWLFTTSLLAQTKEPRLFDEFSKTNSETLEASLSNYAAELSSNSDSLLQILIHRGEKESLGSPYRFLAVMKSYLIFLGISEKRVITTNCEPEKGRWVQVWLLTNSLYPKNCSQDSFTYNKTTLFDSAYYSNSVLGSCCKVDELGDAQVDASLFAFARELKKIPESKAYIYLYLGTNIYWAGSKNEVVKPVRILDHLSLLRKMRKSVVKILAENGVETSRIIMKYGGYKDSPRNMELWLVPKGDEIPKIRVNYFPRRKRNK